MNANHRTFLTVCVVSLLLGLSWQTYAQPPCPPFCPPSPDEVEVFTFGIDARALGMAESMTALADSYSAPNWNPAGLPFTKGLAFGGTYVPPSNSGSGQLLYGSIGIPVSGMAFGLSYARSQPGNTISGDTEQLIVGTAALRLLDVLAFGVNVNANSQKLQEGAFDQSFSLGGGLMLQPLPTLRVGVTNLQFTAFGGNGASAGTIQPSLQGFQAGTALRVLDNAAKLAIQWNSSDGVIRVGTEFAPLRMLLHNPGLNIPLRFGLMVPPEGDMLTTVGTGLHITFMQVDMAIVLGNSPNEMMSISGGLHF